MEARTRAGRLPEVRSYTGHTGNAPSTEWETVCTEKGTVVRTVWHDPSKIQFLPRRPENTAKAEKKKRLPKPDEKEMARIREMMEKGMSTKEIAQTLKRPEGCVRRYERQIRQQA